jgi:hypothetical protein
MKEQKRLHDKINSEKDFLKLLAKSWNNLDTQFIENELSEDIIYESQWVLTPIEGKKTLLPYLQSKFLAIKNVMQTNLMIVTAELANCPTIQNRPCIILTQVTQNGITQVSVLIKIQENKISRIDVCFIPDPKEATLTGEFPK